MNKVVLQGYIQVPTDDLAEVLAALPIHTALTRAEAGCLVFNVTQSQCDPCRFEVYEEFASRADFDAHQHRVRQSEWGARTVRVERHYHITE